MSQPDDREAIRDSGPQASALPIDSDVDSTTSSGTHARPVHLQWRYIMLVGVGGALGTLARYGAGLMIPQAWQLPWPTLTVNLLGAFALGVLLTGLARRGADEGRRRALRLLIGTGFMGGFTTYSSLAVETAGLLRDDRLWAGIGYGLVTLVVGVFATAFGMWAAAAYHRAAIRRSSNRARSGVTP